MTVLKPGLLTSVQAGPRRGMRHIGVPASGAADPLSLALANRLVGNAWDAPALELTAVGPSLRFDADYAIAIAGAPFDMQLNGAVCAAHRSFMVHPDDVLDIGSTAVGMRAYLAAAGGIESQHVLGSNSTYLPGRFGGFEGRALARGDVLAAAVPRSFTEIETPAEFRPPVASSWAVRTCASCETELLEHDARDALFSQKWIVDRRADRMGMRLDGPSLAVQSAGRMPSAAVFPGTVQCTEGGSPFLLGADAGTTGGYPRVAQVARCDRHLLGQMRPGDSLLLLERAVDDANRELAEKADYWQAWLPDMRDIL
ncbi:MAG: biotin-dependent carboxyltransferase family protein [Woeseiaceae bacterium]|nr:biotin-dependent carboxyltransferase family protein [Woeseiaceae bacterium]